MNNVRKVTLDNGLIVILKEIHHAPLISWWMLYRVGSRNERRGLSGVSHWVEHMMFKGTKKYPAGYLDQEIDRIGGIWNAQTSMDYTGYFETLPADKIQLALDLEADRMFNCEFSPSDVESERTVVISERQGLENSPTFLLSEAITNTAFEVHNYKNEIIGNMVDLERISRDDLYTHYQTYYVPNNAIAVAVGAFNADKLLDKIVATYAELTPTYNIPKYDISEILQMSERRITIKQPGQTAFLEVAYHAPPAQHDDWFKLAILDSVLSGPSELGGGMIDNKTSRLYRALVATEVAVSADGNLSPTIDPYLYHFYVTVRDGYTLEQAEKILFQELDRVRQEKISDYELNKAKKQARALFAYSTESVTGQAFWLAFAENFSSYEWFEQYVSKLEAVTADDVLDVAQKYLDPARRTVGWFVPDEEAFLEENEL